MSDAGRSVVGSATKAMSRRTLLLQGSAAAVVVSGLGKLSFAQTEKATPSPVADKSRAFPDKFLWGCATAGYQVEGNNTNSELWMMEYLPGSIFKEPSGDACDHYHLYPQDISMVAGQDTITLVATDALPAASGRALALRPRYAQTV